MARTITSSVFDHISGAAVRVASFFQEVGAGLDALHRVQFDAPWQPVRKPTYGEW